VGKPEGKKLLGRPRYKWKYNIKRDLKELGRGCELDSSGSEGWALVNTVMKFHAL
jgi:hypothetical protein